MVSQTHDVRSDRLAAVRAALGKGDPEAASRLAEAMVAEGARHPLLLNLAAYRRELAGDYSQAVELLSQALELAPDDSQILNSLGVCYSKAGRPEDALEVFDAALVLSPT